MIRIQSSYICVLVKSFHISFSGFMAETRELCGPGNPRYRRLATSLSSWINNFHQFSLKEIIIPIIIIIYDGLIKDKKDKGTFTHLHMGRVR